MEENSGEKECLITMEPLSDNYILLPCGHTFNYEPLYYELVYQKTQKILDNSDLRINEIKCPYCRSVSSQILPYFKRYDLKVVSGVNMPAKYSMKIYTCEHINKNSKNNNVCGASACKSGFGYLCNKHYIREYNKSIGICPAANKNKNKNKNINKNKNTVETCDKGEQENMDMDMDMKDYRKMTIPELKNILRINHCRLGGRKAELLERIKTAKLNNSIWVE